MRTHISRQSALRLLALAALALGVMALTGCQGTLYDDKVTLPGLKDGVPSFYILQGIILGALGLPVHVVAVCLLWRVIFPPFARVKIPGMKIELWVSKRKYPWMAASQAFVVPVAPDLKMNFGAAKIARDWGANRAQYEAEQIAPLVPGDVFLGSGSRYRWAHTALAVIFDNQKRTNPELISVALQRALKAVSDEGATSALIPDLTDNLSAQPNWITDEQREETARQSARLILDSLAASAGTVQIARIWVFDPRNAEIYVEEMEKWAIERETRSAATA